MSVTEELNELIALHGNCRDALNVTLAKLRQAESEIAILKEAAQQSVQADKCPACDGKGWFGAQFCEGEECPTCEGTGICR